MRWASCVATAVDDSPDLGEGDRLRSTCQLPAPVRPRARPGAKAVVPIHFGVHQLPIYVEQDNAVNRLVEAVEQVKLQVPLLSRGESVDVDSNRNCCSTEGFTASGE